MIALGIYTTCAISPRMLVCWDNNAVGQTTVQIAFRKAYSVDTVFMHTYALAHIKNKSTVGCWGNNIDGQTNVPQHVYAYNKEDDMSNLRNRNDDRGKLDENKV